MSNIDKRALREAAEKASTDNHTQDEWFHYLRCSTPETVLALLDEIAELEQGHCGTALLEREEMHTKNVGRLMGELEAKDRRITEMEAKLETAPKVPEATFESPDIPPVEPNWNDPTLREPGIWAYGFLEGQKVNLSNQ